ncbi:MAG: hypothetical protein EAZ92_03045 [Candidatus Kapaibacterium sp.]|nr:MAG: hypothetical protein EAZ92_03045 [Candidatus Kapabacteria bacterium]
MRATTQTRMSVLLSDIFNDIQKRTSKKHSHNSMNTRFYCIALLFSLIASSSGFAQEGGASLPARSGSGATQQNNTQTSNSAASVQSYELPNPYIRFGVFGAAAYNQHSVGFRELVPSCCPQNFPNVNVLSFTAGAMAEVPIAGPFGVALRAGFTPLAATFQALGSLRSSVGGDPRDIPTSYNLETNLTLIEGQLLLWVRPLPRLSLYVGGQTGFFFRRNFYQYEKLLDENLVFETDTSIRAQVRGDIPTRLPLWLTGGLSYEIPLNPTGTIMLAPEVSYSLQLPNNALFNILQDNSKPWRIASIRGGVSVRFSPNKTVLEESEVRRMEEQRQQEPRREITQNQQPNGTPTTKSNQPLTIKLYPSVGVGADGSETANPTIRIEDVSATKSRYILPAVFFDEKNAALPAKYNQITAAQKALFKPESLSAASELETYYHVLNIIGQRMNTKTKAKLTLTGGADALGEKNNKQLAQTRAELVKKYLTDVWGITASRIMIQTRNSVQANNDVLEAEEARRVDISSDTPDVLDEMRFDYRGKVVTPPIIRAKFDIEAPAGLQNWKLEASQDGTPLKTVRGGNRYPNTYEWNLASAPLDSLPQTAREISLRVEAVDNNSTMARSTVQQIPVETQQNGKKPSSAVRTDIYTVYSTMRGEGAFSSADASVQRQLLNIMRKGIKPTSKLLVSGYTDARTPSENARTLTEQAAQNVTSQLNMQDVMVSPGGISSFHDNSLPEGRFYNRFVQVEIRTLTK